MGSKIIIVNKNDKVIGYKDRDKITSSDIYRVSSLWIVNSKGETLLARRAYTKSHDPGKWGPAVAGTVEKGETYYSNIIKESGEELGLLDVKPIKAHKERFFGKWTYFCQWYMLKDKKSEVDFKINRHEIVEIRWFSKKALKKELDEKPEEFIGSIENWVKLFDKFSGYVD